MKAFIAGVVAVFVISAAAALVLDGIDSSSAGAHQSRFGATRL